MPSQGHGKFVGRAMTDETDPSIHLPSLLDAGGADPGDPLLAKLETFEANPRDLKLLAELRGEARKANRKDILAPLFEARAPLEKERPRAIQMWWDAVEARLELGPPAKVEENLRGLLALDPGHEKGAALLATRLKDAGRLAELAHVLEAELEVIEAAAIARDVANQTPSPDLTRRRVDRHRRLGRLWEGELGRVERALHHWQRAWQLEPDDPTALEAARSIYLSLGDEGMVVRLYELELEAVSTTRPGRKAELLVALGQLRARRGEARAAAEHLEQALGLLPDDEANMEALADQYSTLLATVAPNDRGKAQGRAVELFTELGARRGRIGDLPGAIGFWRRAIGLDPRAEPAGQRLEDALEKTSGWEELERHHRLKMEYAEADDDVARRLSRRGELLLGKLGQREAAKRCFEALAAREAPGGPAWAQLRTLYAEDGDWAELAALIEREVDVDVGADGDDKQVDLLLELATIVREHLGDKERAAEVIHRALTLDPNHPVALARYADHFREKRDWRGLADLAEFAADAAREAGMPLDEQVRRLEEFAKVCELRLGDVERSIAAWRRIESMNPEHARAKEAIRSLLARSRMWESMIGVLEKEAESAPGPRERAEALKRIAHVFRERQVDPRRAIALYEEGLQLVPDDPSALKALAELYEREGDDAGVARTLRRQVETEATRVAEQAEKEGKSPPAYKEWPQQARVERMALLRRLALIYETRTHDTEGVVYASTYILELLPGDRDALERLERVLEKSGDQTRLEQTLEYHAEAVTGPADRAKILKRLARLTRPDADPGLAIGRWERVLKVSPNDEDALAALADLYERTARHAELASVLERLRVAAEVAQARVQLGRRRQRLRVIGRDVEDTLVRLQRAPRVAELAAAQEADLEPADRLHAGIVGEVDLTLGDADRVLEVAARLVEPAERAVRLEVLRIDVAQQGLERQDRVLGRAEPFFEQARVLQRELDRARALLGAAQRDLPLQDVGQAAPLADLLVQARERGERLAIARQDRRQLLPRPQRASGVTDLRVDDGRVAAQLVGAGGRLRRARLGHRPRDEQALERLAERSPAGRERRNLFLRVAQVNAERLNDPAQAFYWTRRAHEEDPDVASLAEVRRSGETFGLWNELTEVYEAERERLRLAGDLGGFVVVSRELVLLIEQHLNDVRRALEVLRDTVVAMPDDDGLLVEAERLPAARGDAAANRDLWRVALAIFEVALERRPEPARRVLLCEQRARIREERLADATGALEELLRAFALDPERASLRGEILRLAEKTGRWEDALAMEAALELRAVDLPARLRVRRRTAGLLEEKLASPVRAFRVLLGGLPLAPDDGELGGELWRLARALGAYAEADQRPKAEPAPLAVEAPPLAPPPGSGIVIASTGGPASASRPNRAGPPPLPGLRRDPTIQLSVEDLQPANQGASPLGEQSPPSLPGRGDPTIPLGMEDLAPMVRRDPTIQLSVEDLAPVARPPATPPSARRPPPPPARRMPQVSLPGVAPSRAAALEIRKYKSAWEELATAIAELPAHSGAAWLKNLYRAADVWERGATDIDRAFEVLARALEAAPDDPEPRARLERLAAEHKAWTKLATLFEAAAERADSPRAITRLLEDAGEVHIGHGEKGAAEGVLRRILGIQPDRPGTRDKLEDLLREQGRWVDLAASLEERTEDRHAGPHGDAERPVYLRELGVTYATRLAKPYEAISAYERLRNLVPGDLDALEQLAELYAQVGRWAKVTDALTRVADLVEGEAQKPLHLADAAARSRPPAKAREARRRIAEVYDKELELPERAIEAYQTVISMWPDDDKAYAALDQLLEQHARWEDLAEILRRRAALAPDPAARAFFLRRRARVYLDWLKNPEEAVANLRHARTVTPDDVTLAEEMVDALASSGRAREAAAVLEGRIADLEQESSAKAAPGDVAALLLRLAILRASKLDDLDGARRALDKVLDRMPEHPTALALLAKLADGAGDPRTFAEARLREAAAAVDVGTKVSALLDAGVALRDRVSDVEGARRAFAAVLELEPANAEATWALSGLSTNVGDLDGAAQILERRLLQADEPEERARVLTELAAIAQANGVRAMADHRLREALEAKPDHIPAIVARADLLEADARLEELEQFLAAALPRLADAKPGEARTASPGEGRSPQTAGPKTGLDDVRVELGRRLAAAHERLGRDEEAYARLLEVDKVKRGDLLTKLALGENRYRARRWREAALHLSSLVDHPEAPTRAADVAEGLYHAALAEVRALRTDRAPALYEAALRLKPDYGPALHALAEIAMEKGEIKTAASLLERQAAASPNPSERLRLYEALGDLNLVALGDEAHARTCFEQAVASASPLESRHLPLLDKLLSRQRAAGDQLACARTLDLISSFEGAPARRIARAIEAADAYRAGGEPTRARAALDRAIEADPFDEDVVFIASEIHLALADAEAAASVLGKALLAWDAGEAKSGSPPRGPDAVARRAELWRRLGDARALRGDPRGAQIAFERAIQVGGEAGPPAPAVLPARRGLLALFADDATLVEVSRELLRAVVQADPRGPELLALARSLAVETGAGAVDEDGARVMFELAAAAGEIISDDDRAFLAKKKGRQMAADEAYAGVLDDAERAELLAEPDEGALPEVLAAVWEAAPLLWGDPAKALEQFGASGAERVPPVASGASASIYAQVAKALNAPLTVLYQTPAPGTADVSVICTAPPIILLGPRVTATTASPWHGTVEPATDSELRFLLGRALELARPERLAAAGLPAPRFAKLVHALWHAFAPGKRTNVPADIEAEAERLRKTLPVKVRLRVEAAFEAHPAPPDPDAYRAASERAAERAGLLVSGDAVAAVRLVGGPDKAAHLFRLAVRERTFAVRAKLGLGER